MMRAFRSAHPLALAFCLGGVPAMAHAQTRTASDISGATVTSAALLGGSFVPGVGLRPVPVGSARFDPSALARIRGAATALENQVTRGELTGPSGQAIDASAQLAVLGVLKSGATGAGLSADALRGVLERGVPDKQSLAQALVDALVDMGATPAPVQVAVAARALNAYVAAADPAFLAAPPSEFVAVFAVVQRYAAAATQNAPGSAADGAAVGALSPGTAARPRE